MNVLSLSVADAYFSSGLKILEMPEGQQVTSNQPYNSHKLNTSLLIKSNLILILKLNGANYITALCITGCAFWSNMYFNGADNFR